MEPRDVIVQDVVSGLYQINTVLSSGIAQRVVGVMPISYVLDENGEFRLGCVSTNDISAPLRTHEFFLMVLSDVGIVNERLRSNAERIVHDLRKEYAQVSITERIMSGSIKRGK